MTPFRALFVVPLLLAWSIPARAQPPGAARVAVLVGANGAAPGRKPLLYSHRDVERMADVLRTVGGFAPSNVFVLKDLQDEGKRFEELQYVTLGVTALSLLATGPCYYLWLRDEPAAGLSWAPLVAPGMGGLSAGFRF